MKPLRVAHNLSVSVGVENNHQVLQVVTSFGGQKVAFMGLVGDLHLENQSRSRLEEADSSHRIHGTGISTWLLVDFYGGCILQ